MAVSPSAPSDVPPEKTLFDAANELRGSVESAEYKHLVLGLIFLAYISSSFERCRVELERTFSDPESDFYYPDETMRAEALEDRDEYTARHVFWVPKDVRWERLLEGASQDNVAEQIDTALRLIEDENESLRNVLPRIYRRAPISSQLLGRLVETIGRINFGSTDGEARDVLGRVYEYFIKEFARAEGHRGGEFYTPANVVRLLVEMLEPMEGRVFDPASGSNGMFVQSAKFIAAHGGNPDAISIYGQERNQATWRIGQMNLAIHGLNGDVKYNEGGSLLADAHPNLRADYVLANPPFNQKKWATQAALEDPRWVYGVPPEGNANYAWIQTFISHLAPNGRAGFVLANGSLTTVTGGEDKIRQNIVDADLVDCIVALPAQLFYTTGIPVCLWFLDRNKKNGTGPRDRSGETLFIDARSMGQKISRTQIELTADEIDLITRTYHAWRGQPEAGEYTDEPGFCAAATISDIQAAGGTLSPGRYVGAPEEEEDEVAFEERMATLVEQLGDDLARSAQLGDAVRSTLESIGYAP
jgi:type I restriction enzyme M protein